jgi:hypothetical protein
MFPCFWDDNVLTGNREQTLGENVVVSKRSGTDYKVMRHRISVDQDFLTFFAMDPFESLAKHTDPFPEIFIYMDKIEIVRFVEVSKILESEEQVTLFQY